jgi:hypothetical protein
MTFQATLSSGDILPKWLRFYSNNLTFMGVPLKAEILKINLTSYDQYLSNTTIQFTINAFGKNHISTLNLERICAYTDSQPSELTYQISHTLFAHGNSFETKVTVLGMPNFLQFDPIGNVLT